MLAGEEKASAEGMHRGGQEEVSQHTAGTRRSWLIGAVTSVIVTYRSLLSSRALGKKTLVVTIYFSGDMCLTALTAFNN
jgi:hypothetical protein